MLSRVARALCSRVAVRSFNVQRLAGTRELRASRIWARTVEGIMAFKTQYTEFRHWNTMTQLQGLAGEEAKKHPPIVRERGGVAVKHWEDGSRVCCREVKAFIAIAWRSPARAIWPTGSRYNRRSGCCRKGPWRPSEPQMLGYAQHKVRTRYALLSKTTPDKERICRILRLLLFRTLCWMD